MSTAVRHDRSRRINRELVTTYVIVAVLMAYFALRHFYPTLFRVLRQLQQVRPADRRIFLRRHRQLQLWIWIYHRDLGLLNWALSLVGIGKIGWLVDTRYALSSIIIMNVWREMGFALVIFMAGLKTIPEHFYDAARVDGASAWQVARRVTIPLLTPITLLVVVVNTIGAFKVFTQVFVMGQQGGTYFGGPMNSTLTIVLKIYETSFTDFRIGVGQSLAFVLTAIVVVITTIQRKAFKRFDYDY